MTMMMSTDHHMNMTMAPPPSSMHMKKMMMHMTFFWGRRVDILFSGWPGDRGIAAYLLALLLVFVLSFLVELLSFLPLRSHHRRLSSAVMVTGVTVLRTGFSYLVMLSVMSFNVGVLLVVVAGHAIGFFVFGSGLFFRRWPKEEENGGGPKC
ncbi:uncharacterized protein A4U43_C02F680 [Asparagus officinalis]|uniref:Copper transport protein n=1 Tax=Asparagus officinalis TaxID=4686 RepID=A0A5P1FHH1_ASPOF|nr:copper transporter 6-like [Asparagus officinalis]ONK76867.1 uncharacterized protein A4U43_C02F680 [Asparagus officinalis]